VQLVLTEKPSVARDIARVLGVKRQAEGYLESDELIVTWAYGHLLELCPPEAYNPAWKKWTLQDLPLLPGEFRLAPSGDEGARRQLAVIATLLDRAETVVCATDAGREGELIFRSIVSYLGGAGKPVHRLWISSMTDEAIKKGFAALRAGAEFDRLYQAARCRRESDWIVGMNLTRLYTLLHGTAGEVLSVGRVQTPVLAMIVQRYLEIQGFRAETYFSLETRYRGVRFKYEHERLTDAAAAHALLAELVPAPLTIVSLERREQEYVPPLLFDLTGLQRVANIKYGLTAEQTLEVAQKLYEGKVLTYPRTDSSYLTTDLVPTLPALLEKLRPLRPAAVEGLDLSNLPITPRLVDDSKVGDHHAIIPTGVLPTKPGQDESRIYDLVLDRFLAAFYPPCLKALTTVHADLAGHRFKAGGVEVLRPGWHVVLPEERTKEGKEGDEEQGLPQFTVGEKGEHRPELLSKKTKAPRHHTEASLLAAMETAGKDCEDEDLRQALKDKGLGTPATRAGIIELLCRRGYMFRQGKRLLPSERGIRLEALVRDHRLKSAEMTGEWEARLKSMERGKGDPAAFMAEITEFTRTLIDGNRGELAVAHARDLGPCPRCGRPVIRGRKDFGCSGFREGCSFVLPSQPEGFLLGFRQVAEVLRYGRTLAPLSSDQPGRERSFALLDTETGISLVPAGTKPETMEGQVGTCPICGGEILEDQWRYACRYLRRGCAFELRKTLAGRSMERDILDSLLTSRRTPPLSGFLSSRTGKTFTAALRVSEDGGVVFDFENKN